MEKQINYIYICEYYTSDSGNLTIGNYTNEQDALDKMIQLCKIDEIDGGYSWLFDEYDEYNELTDLDCITSYDEFNRFIMNNCKPYYNDWVYYLYIEKVELK
jgi:hypothetical protein